MSGLGTVNHGFVPGEFRLAPNWARHTGARRALPGRPGVALSALNHPPLRRAQNSAGAEQVGERERYRVPGAKTATPRASPRLEQSIPVLSIHLLKGPIFLKLGPRQLDLAKPVSISQTNELLGSVHTAFCVDRKHGVCYLGQG